MIYVPNRTFSGTDWILGWGHSIHKVLEYIEAGKGDPKDILDYYVKDENGQALPVIIMEATSHSMWVSSEALRLAGIDRNSPNPVGGIIMKNDQGEPNGGPGRALISYACEYEIRKKRALLQGFCWRMPATS